LYTCSDFGNRNRVSVKIYFSLISKHVHMRNGTVIVHLETVPAPQGERYGPDFKKMNKAAAIQYVIGISLAQLLSVDPA